MVPDPWQSLSKYQPLLFSPSRRTGEILRAETTFPPPALQEIDVLQKHQKLNGFQLSLKLGNHQGR
jgi:hypothetical protein